MIVAQERAPIAADLFEETAEGTTLFGGRRRNDGAFVFPFPGGAEAERYERVPLARTGRLWSWTVQRFQPKSPPYLAPRNGAPFEPFAVGYVELAQIIVEARLAIDDFAALRIGMEMEVTAVPIAQSEDGRTLTTYAFRPVQPIQGAGA